MRFFASTSHYPHVDSHRRLPHRYPPNTALFLTWTLHGSLPGTLYTPPNYHRAGHAFVWMDRYLDQTTAGPQYLRDPRIAAIVETAILEGEASARYHLHAYVVMPNHVHVLLTPITDVSDALKRIKGTSARASNLLLARTGHPFWQPESYDHWVRNESEFDRIHRYIEQNPVRAALAAEPHHYRYSSAWHSAKHAIEA